MPSDLTGKQRRFCREYFEGKTGTQAAIEAGYAFGSAKVTASRLLTHDNVAAHLSELQQQADDESVATVLERKQVLTEILRGRLARFVTDDMNPKMLDDAALQEVRIVHFTGSKDAPDSTTTTIKLNDPVKAIDLLNKMERIYGEMGIVIDNRSVHITVASEEGKEMTKRIMAGEGTGKETEG